jgi:predicted phage-related endonuclease
MSANSLRDSSTSSTSPKADPSPNGTSSERSPRTTDATDALLSVTRTTVAKPADRDKWLAERKPYFNASASAVLFDRHPFQTPGDYATVKLTGDEGPQTRAMARGQHLEAAVANWWAADNNCEVYEPDVLYVAGPIMATLDRIAVGGLYDGFPVQIKTTSHRVSTPEQYWLDQCQAEMLCAGTDFCELVWFDSSLDYESVTVHADREFQTELLARAERFMAAIEFGMIPDVRLSASNIAAVFPEPVDAVEFDADAVTALRQYVVLGTRIKALEEERARIKDVLAAEMLDHAEATYDGETVLTWKATKGRESFDRERFRAEHPDLHNQYVARAAHGPRMFTPKITTPDTEESPQ